MRIQKLRIKNLRAFEDEEIDFDSYTSLVGANGAGKSTVLCALNIFFRQIEGAPTNTSELDAEDFHLKNTDVPIQITVTFTDLSPSAQILFSEYFRHGSLVISAEAKFDQQSGRASVWQFGQRTGMNEFRDFFGHSSSGEKVADLKIRFATLREQFPEIREAKIKQAMHDALHEYEEAHPDLCTLIRSQDHFYGFSKGANRLAESIQWVYVPAVKDAIQEQVEARNTALGRLLARTVRQRVSFTDQLNSIRTTAREQYVRLLDSQQGALDEISANLQSRLGEWAHPDATVRLAWHQESQRSVQVEEPFARMLAGEGDFEGELARFGHGFQRSYLLALLQELASHEAPNAPTLILGIEEPELYQHPPQARHLSSVLEALSEKNAQVIVATHSPHFISGKSYESVRAVRRSPKERKSVVRAATASQVAAAIDRAKGNPPTDERAVLAKLNQVLMPHINEMFFTPNLILTEGSEDIAYISTWMLLSDRWDEFRRLGCHFVSVGGKSELLQPLAAARLLEIPTYTVFDSDGGEQQVERRKMHQRDNDALLAFLGDTSGTSFPPQNIIGPSYTIWSDTITTAIQGDFESAVWLEAGEKASSAFGHSKGFGKNSMHIGARLAYAHAKGARSKSLENICDRILAFAAA